MIQSKIEWTDSTINPTSGCDGCELYHPTEEGTDDFASCYAYGVHVNRLSKSLPALYAPRFDEVRLIPGRCMEAANWSDLRGKQRKSKPWLDGKPRHIFVGDLGDIFSRAVDFEFLKRELIGAIESKNGQRHVWQILTKRPARMAEFAELLGGLPENVIAMTSVTNQRTADFRVPALCGVRCKWRGLSIEPLLGSVDLAAVKQEVAPGFFGDCLQWYHRGACHEAAGIQFPTIHWVICGGESGSHALPMHPNWVRNLRDQCAEAAVPFFFKQWGEWGETAQMWKGSVLLAPNGKTYPNNTDSVEFKKDYPFRDGHALLAVMTRQGKGNSGRLIDNATHNGMPELAVGKVAA